MNIIIDSVIQTPLEQLPLPTNNDEWLINHFATNYSKDSLNTQRRYASECSKLMHWLRAKRKTLSPLMFTITKQETFDYLEFLKEPYPLDKTFILYRKKQGTPFLKKLSHTSVKSTLSILFRFYAFYNQAQKEQDNPFYDARERFNEILVVPPKKVEILTKQDIRLIFDYIENLPKATLREAKRYHMLRWLISLIYYGFFKTTEIKTLKMSQFVRQKDSLWYLMWMRNNKEISVPVTDRFIKELFFYRSSLGMRKHPSSNESNLYAITGIYKENNPLSAELINIIIKDLIGEIVNKFKQEDTLAGSISRIANANSASIRKAGIVHSLSSTMTSYKYRLIYAQIKKTPYKDLLIV